MPRLHQPDPEPGTTYNHFSFVRSERDQQDGRHYWVCECACGKLVRRRPYSFTKGWIRSCGCKRGGANHRLWKGCGSLSGYYFACVRSSAKNRQIPFGLTIEYAWHVFEQQEGRCAFTGLPLTFSTGKLSHAGQPGTASLDRKDSSKGYVKGNVQWVHKDVNYMKNDMSEERFIELCKLVAANVA